MRCYNCIRLVQNSVVFSGKWQYKARDESNIKAESFHLDSSFATAAFAVPLMHPSCQENTTSQRERWTYLNFLYDLGEAAFLFVTFVEHLGRSLIVVRILRIHLKERRTFSQYATDSKQGFGERWEYDVVGWKSFKPAMFTHISPRFHHSVQWDDFLSHHSQNSRWFLRIFNQSQLQMSIVACSEKWHWKSKIRTKKRLARTCALCAILCSSPSMLAEDGCCGIGVDLICWQISGLAYLSQESSRPRRVFGTSETCHLQQNAKLPAGTYFIKK